MNTENARLLKEVKLSHTHAKDNEQQLFKDIQTRDAVIEQLKKDATRVHSDRMTLINAAGSDGAAKAEIKRLVDELESLRRNSETEKV